MKVYELINELSKCPAGDEVYVSMTATATSELECVDKDAMAESVLLGGGDAQLIDEDGEELGLLSEMASGESEE